jgi:hypothetical protein
MWPLGKIGLFARSQFGRSQCAAPRPAARAVHQRPAACVDIRWDWPKLGYRLRFIFMIFAIPGTR